MKIVKLTKYAMMVSVYKNVEMTMIAQMETLVMVVHAYQDKQNVNAQMNVLVEKYAKMVSVFLNGVKMTTIVQMGTLVIGVDAYQDKHNVKAQTNVLVVKSAKMACV